MSSEMTLLPCPFCGGTDIALWTGFGTQADIMCEDCCCERNAQVADLFEPDERPKFDEHTCRYPDAAIERVNQHLISEWNTRTERDDALALAAKLNGEVETMRAVLTEHEKRWKDVHNMVLKARELVRLDIEPDNRPVGLFQSLQDALYAIRGRAALIPNHPAGEEK